MWVDVQIERRNRRRRVRRGWELVLALAVCVDALKASLWILACNLRNDLPEWLGGDDPEPTLILAAAVMAFFAAWGTLALTSAVCRHFWPERYVAKAIEGGGGGGDGGPDDPPQWRSAPLPTGPRTPAPLEAAAWVEFDDEGDCTPACQSEASSARTAQS